MAEEKLTKGSGIAYGFKKFHIFLYSADGTFFKKFILEGKTGEGASQKLEIEGLSKEPTSVAGSNTIYYQSRKGTGKVSANATLIDMPFEIENAILGRKITTEGTAMVGADTEAPYAAIIGESETANGDKIYAGLLRGVFRREKFDLGTLDPNEDFKPEGVEYGFSAENFKSDDKDYDGQVFAYHVGTEESAKKLFAILEQTTLPPTGGETKTAKVATK